MFLSQSLMGCQAPYDALVNLGGDCQMAWQMHINGIRQCALPFDKLITPFEALHSLLENKFEHFLEAENLEFIKETKHPYVIDNRYGVRLIHDFKLQDDFLKDYTEIKATYERRIKRLLEIMASSEKTLFIRKRITKEQAVSLHSLLQKTLGPQKSFLLVALDDSDEIKADWHLEGVKNFYLRQLEPYVWKGDDAAWREIFTALGLTLSTAQNSIKEA